MKNGIIKLDSKRGEAFGFTSLNYEGYLWKMDSDTIVISFIVSKARGNFRKLVERIHALGYAVQVPTPLGRMQDIVKRNGYVHTQEHDKEMGGMVDLWTLEPPR